MTAGATAAPHPFGLHRSIDPPGVLPQLARRLDATPRALENEIAVAVRALSIDSASFRQLRETEASTGETVRDQIARIVRERGKMQNPVTGSGGMLLGEIAAVGPRHPAAGSLTPGTAIASLVSLTLTPLHLESIGAVHMATERVEVTGTAILFSRTLFARLPEDFPEEVALAAFDVAGAPAGVLRDAKPGQTVLVIGTGKAGLLCLAAAREAVGKSGRVLAVEPSLAAAGRARALNLADAVFTVDARDPVAMLALIETATSGRLADLVVNVANVSGTEAASVLCAQGRGRRDLLRHGDILFRRGARRRGARQAHPALHRQRLRPRPRPDRPGPASAPPGARRCLRVALGKAGGVSAASTALAETIRGSGARRVAFLGLAKNAGKTTALTAVLAELHRAGLPAGATSAGRDGEEFDAITGEPKPRFRVFPGQLIASAATTFEAAAFPLSELATLPFATRFGPVQLRRADGEGELEVIGPSTASQLALTAAALEAAGAEIVLLDGAVGRRAFAAGRVCDGIVLSVGMSAGDSLPAVLAATASAAELIGLAAAPPEARTRPCPGAITELSLQETAPAAGETLVGRGLHGLLSPARSPPPAGRARRAPRRAKAGAPARRDRQPDGAGPPAASRREVPRGRVPRDSRRSGVRPPR